MPAQAQSYVEQTQKVLALRQREAEVRRARERDVEALFNGVSEARADIAKALKVFQERIGLAQKAVRLSASDDAAQYRVCLTLQLRMAGAIQQALVRAESMNRRLDSVKAERLERERLLAQQQADQALRQASKDVQRTLMPQADDFDLLYGDGEEVNDAS